MAKLALSPDTDLMKIAVRFFVIFALLQTGLWLLAYNGLLDPLLALTADMTGSCSNATGVQATVAGNDVYLASRILRIDPECTGLSIAIVYAALVLAYPLSSRDKLMGICLGLPVLFVANMIRLTAVAQLSGRLEDDAFLFVHDYLFKIGMVIIVILVWGAYLSWARHRASSS